MKTNARSVHLTRSVTVGRSPSTDIHIDDPKVSRWHCRMYLDGGGAWVVDLGSTNGTRVNGETVLDPRRIKDGDLVEAGPVRLEIRL